MGTFRLKRAFSRPDMMSVCVLVARPEEHMFVEKK
jgi:hypothetical protein